MPAHPSGSPAARPELPYYEDFSPATAPCRPGPGCPPPTRPG